MAAPPPSSSTMPRKRYQTQCSAICASALATASVTCWRVSATPASIAARDKRSAIVHLLRSVKSAGLCLPLVARGYPQRLLGQLPCLMEFRGARVAIGLDFRDLLLQACLRFTCRLEGLVLQRLDLRL